MVKRKLHLWLTYTTSYVFTWFAISESNFLSFSISVEFDRVIVAPLWINRDMWCAFTCLINSNECEIDTLLVASTWGIGCSDPNACIDSAAGAFGQAIGDKKWKILSYDCCAAIKINLHKTTWSTCRQLPTDTLLLCKHAYERQTPTKNDTLAQRASLHTHAAVKYKRNFSVMREKEMRK